jgi:hypothetical protein
MGMSRDTNKTTARKSGPPPLLYFILRPSSSIPYCNCKFFFTIVYMPLFLEQRKENVMDKITPQAGKPLLVKNTNRVKINI